MSKQQRELLSVKNGEYSRPFFRGSFAQLVSVPPYAPGQCEKAD